MTDGHAPIRDDDDSPGRVVVRRRRCGESPWTAAALVLLASSALMQRSPPSWQRSDSPPARAMPVAASSSLFSFAFLLPHPRRNARRLCTPPTAGIHYLFDRDMHPRPFHPKQSSSSSPALEAKSSPPSHGGENGKKTSKKRRMSKSVRKSRRKKSATNNEEEDDIARHVQSVYANDHAGMGDRQRTEYLRRLDARPALVLNADYQPLRMLPLSVWSWKETVKAVFGGKVVVVDVYPDVSVRAASLVMAVPSVIALREYVAAAHKVRPAFTRRNVFLRDGYRCQYCRGVFRTSDLSLDHVEPRCHGGGLTWENTVAACRKCNGRKGSLRVSELSSVGMVLTSFPRIPSRYELVTEANNFVPRKVCPTWAPFLALKPESTAVSSAEVRE